MKKKILSILLAIFVIVPCVFMLTACGFSSKEEKLGEARAIKLVGDTSTLLNQSINTIGNGLASSSSTQSSSASSYDAGDYYCLLDSLTEPTSNLEQINYLLNASSETQIELGKTYMYVGEESTTYVTIYSADNSVVFEMSSSYYVRESDEVIVDKGSTIGIIDYNNSNYTPSAVTIFTINEGYYESYFEEGYAPSDIESDGYRILFSLYSVDFDQKTFARYYSQLNGMNSLDELNPLRDKLSNGTLRYYDIIENLSGAEDENTFIYIGKIANNAKDINMSSFEKCSKLADCSTLFNAYSDNIKHLEYISAAKSKINTKNSKNITKDFVDFENVLAIETEHRYFYDVDDDGNFVFYGVGDYKKFDANVLAKLKTAVKNIDTYKDGEWHGDIKITLNSGLLSGEDYEIEEATSRYYSKIKGVILDLYFYNMFDESNSYYLSVVLGENDLIAKDVVISGYLSDKDTYVLDIEDEESGENIGTCVLKLTTSTSRSN